MATLNEQLGWILICVGVLSGAAIGASFQDEHFLGGYTARPRRLLRLGHISFFGLGILNLMFAASARPLEPGPGLVVASWGFVAGGVAMPPCCALVAWKRELYPLFVVPVISLAGAAIVTAIGVLHQ